MSEAGPDGGHVFAMPGTLGLPVRPATVASSAGCENVNITGYQVLAELGRGGMAVVYKARDLSLNRLVALKMLLPGSPAGERELARSAR